MNQAGKDKSAKPDIDQPIDVSVNTGVDKRQDNIEALKETAVHAIQVTKEAVVQAAVAAKDSSANAVQYGKEKLRQYVDENTTSAEPVTSFQKAEEMREEVSNFPETLDEAVKQAEFKDDPAVASTEEATTANNTLNTGEPIIPGTATSPMGTGATFPSTDAFHNRPASKL